MLTCKWSGGVQGAHNDEAQADGRVSMHTRTPMAVVRKEMSDIRFATHGIVINTNTRHTGSSSSCARVVLLHQSLRKVINDVRYTLVNIWFITATLARPGMQHTRS